MVLKLIGIKLDLPTILEAENKEIKDLVNTWSVVGRTHHVKTYFLYCCKVKERNIEQVQSKSNPNDLFFTT
jgi:hypothetical protein